MAIGNDAPSTLTLVLGSDTIPYREFQATVRAFTGLLNEITQEVCGERHAIQWEISVSRGSLRISADLPSPTDSKIAGRVIDVIDNPTEQLRNTLRKFPRPVPITRILTGIDRRDILPEPSEEPRRHPSQIAEYGTVEGILDTLSARGRLQFTISEPIWNIAVRCIVPDDCARSMQKMWRERVIAHGMVKYDRNGYPASIDAEMVELFPYDETPLESYRGLLSTD